MSEHNDDEQIIAEIEKNNLETVKVRIGEYRGHQFVDARIFLRPDDRATKKGLAVPPRLLPELIAALTEAARVAGVPLTEGGE